MTPHLLPASKLLPLKSNWFNTGKTTLGKVPISLYDNDKILSFIKPDNSDAVTFCIRLDSK